MSDTLIGGVPINEAKRIAEAYAQHQRHEWRRPSVLAELEAFMDRQKQENRPPPVIWIGSGNGSGDHWMLGDRVESYDTTEIVRCLIDILKAKAKP